MFILDNKKETEHEIKVRYGSLYIDTTDIELPKKYQKMVDAFTRGEQRMQQQEVILKNKKLPEEQHNEQLVDIMIDFVNAVYEAINALFGEGSTEKIFRVKSISALEDFIYNMTDIFQKIGIDSKDYYQKMAKEHNFEPTQQQDNDLKVLD